MAGQILLRETGSADVLKVENVPTPEPQAGEVRIRVKSDRFEPCGSQPERAGTYGKPSKLPLPIGLEAAGTIVAIGTGVADLKLGDAVSVAPAFDTSKYGMYGGRLSLSQELSSGIPRISAGGRGGTWMSFTTAWAGLVDYAWIASGDFVVINAASSSVGLSSI